MESLCARLPGLSFVEPRGGLSVFAVANEALDDRDLLRAAQAQGTSFDPGRMFRVDDDPSPLGMRLCFSNVAEHELDEAVGRLARAWNALGAART
jgi:2-aminoadipate transaminase